MCLFYLAAFVTKFSATAEAILNASLVGNGKYNPPQNSAIQGCRKPMLRGFQQHQNLRGIASACRIPSYIKTSGVSTLVPGNSPSVSFKMGEDAGHVQGIGERSVFQNIFLFVFASFLPLVPAV